MPGARSGAPPLGKGDPAEDLEPGDGTPSSAEVRVLVMACTVHTATGCNWSDSVRGEQKPLQVMWRFVAM
eukprot:3131868-Amphidinium_carterae.1